ncbi:PIN domain-containing protein [Sorangium sp. So ce861]|uniref:PIN domain-containing protein n=1 Tax=Sorangium sp. So ce861 TaxID=3133323 RepID=UPI003F5EE606
MKSFDTNVAVRLVIEDDPDQCERAGRAFRRAVVEGGAFFSATVLVEVAWVLRVACKQDRATVAAALRRLVDAEGVTIEHDAIVRRSLVAFEEGHADFSDYFIRESSREASALPVLTFDERFARGVDVELVPEK